MLNFLRKNILTLLYCLALITFYLFNVSDYFDLIILLFLLVLFFIKDWNPIYFIYGSALCLFLIPFFPNLMPPAYLGDPIGIDYLARYAFFFIALYAIVSSLKWKKIDNNTFKKSPLIAALVFLTLFILFNQKYWSPASVDIKTISKNTFISLSKQDKHFKHHQNALSIRQSSAYQENLNLGDQKHYVNFAITIKQKLIPQQNNLNCLSFNISNKINKIRGTGFNIDITDYKGFQQNGNVLFDQDQNAFDWELMEINKSTKKELMGTVILNLGKFQSFRLRQYEPQKKELLLCFQPRFKPEKEAEFLIPFEITLGREYIIEY